MSSTIKFSRRQAMLSAAALPILAGVSGAPAFAASHGAPAQPIARRFMLGDMEVTTLLAGSMPRDKPQTIFGMNVSEEEFARVSAENFIPADAVQFYFTPTVIKTGDQVVLVDTGLNAAGTTAALADAGYDAKDVDVVVISHMHGDHIGGLMQDGAPTYPNASYVTGQIEYDHWAKAGNERFDQNMRPLAEKTTFINDGASVASGITAMAAFGHTPGHMNFMLESGGQQMLLTVDLANHYVWSLAYPDWEVRFDMDKEAAAASRRKVLGMLAADRVPMVGYHMPFPGAGFVQARGDGFHWVPTSYQFM